MRRRAFITALGGAAVVYPLAARAQQKPMPVIGWLGVGSPEPAAPNVVAFRQGLSELGYVEGKSVAIEYRWAGSHYDRLSTLAADLVGHKVDLIVAAGSAPARAAKSATSTIPIVFAGIGDPVALGLVASLARPGGNITGVASLNATLVPKLFELLFELVLRAKLIALLMNPNSPNATRITREAEDAARTKGVQLATLKASSDSEIEAAFNSLAQQQAGGLVIAADPFFNGRQEQFATLASRHAIPAIYPYRDFVAAGGLISYGTSSGSIYHLVGSYAGRILKGEKPADLPVQQPTKFELVVNLKTAKALGLTVPQTILARADEVIE